MMRWWTVPLVLVATVLGALTTLAARPPSGPGPIDPGPQHAPALLEASPVASVADVLLVWTAGALPDGFGAAVAAIPGISDVTTVYGDRVDLVRSTDADGLVVDAAAPGWAWPLDALAIDPRGYADFVPTAAKPVVSRLERGEALLGTTSAELRRLEPGATLMVSRAHDLHVVDVLDDTTVAAAELVTDLETGRAIGVHTPRFLLVAFDGDRSAVEDAIRRATPDAGVVRVRAPGETPFLRHGDAVLPQALIKQRFGEFAYRPPPDGREFQQDPAWAATNLVHVDLPLIGRARCHRGIVEPLRRALEEVDAEGLDHLIDPDGFAGCWNPRLIAPDGAPSRHAWGIAIDLNAGANPTGTGSLQDPRLVETLRQWGFTWGGFWLVPDPMHFEYLRPARTAGSD